MLLIIPFYRNCQQLSGARGAAVYFYTEPLLRASAMSLLLVAGMTLDLVKGYMQLCCVIIEFCIRQCQIYLFPFSRYTIFRFLHSRNKFQVRLCRFRYSSSWLSSRRQFRRNIPHKRKLRIGKFFARGLRFRPCKK